MEIKNILLVVTLATLVFLGFALTVGWQTPIAAQDLTNRTLIAVMPDDFPPLYCRDAKTGNPAGLAVDILDNVAGIAGLKIEYRFAKAWEEIESLVLSGQADIIPMRIANQATRNRLIFTRNIDISHIAYIIRADENIQRVFDARAKLGLIKGAASLANIKDRTNAQIILYDSAKQLAFDLLSGELDAAVTISENFSFLARDANLEDRVKIINPPLEAVGRGIALAPGNEALRDRLDKALATFLASPKYQLIYDKWYGFPPTFWTVKKVVWSMGGLLLACLSAMAVWRHLGLLRLNQRLTAAISEKREAEAKATELATIVATAQDAIIGMDLQGLITSWNKAAKLLYGYDEPEAIGRHISMLIPEGHADRVASLWDEVLVGRKIEQYETANLTKDGRVVDVSLTFSPLVDVHGKQMGISAISRDITRRKKAEEEKERFVSELRQALSEVKQLSGLLPICANCKKIRDDKGYWQKLENYISEHSMAEFSHGICPECINKLYPEYADKLVPSG